MCSKTIRVLILGFLVALCGCEAIMNSPATIPSTNVNPITGSRGGSGAAN